MTKKSKSNVNWRAVLATFIAILAVIFVYFQKETIVKSIDALKSAEIIYVIVAIFIYSLSVIAAAGVIYNLRLVSKLKYNALLLVQASTLFLGRITPASVGGPAAIARALYTQGHSVVQSGTVVAAGGLATFAGNVLLAGLALLLTLQTVNINDFKPPSFIIYIFAVIFVLAIILINIKAIKDRIAAALQEIKTTLNTYKTRKKSIAYSVICGALVTLAFSLTLMLASKSLGVDISLFAAIITVSLGSIGVAVTPLPGGVVGAEAALAATMVQFGVAADLALAIAFVYRFIIFWLPLLPGFIASQVALKKELL